MIQIQCAYCKRFKDVFGRFTHETKPIRPESPISHGICPDCLEEQLNILGPKRQARKPKQDRTTQALIDTINRDAEANCLFWVAGLAESSHRILVNHLDKLHPLARQAVKHYHEKSKQSEHQKQTYELVM